MITCTRCGTTTQSGNFCQGCGAPLQRPAQPPVYGQPGPNPQPPVYGQPGPNTQPPVYGQPQPPAYSPAHYAQSAPRRSFSPTALIFGLLAVVVIGGAVYLGLGQGGSSTPAAGNSPSAPAPSTKAKAGWVTGTVTDATGAPLDLPASQVVVQVTGDLDDGQSYKGAQQLDRNGRFAVEVPPGKYTASGFVKVDFEGTEFWLGLDPVGGRALKDSKAGVVQDLRWLLSGERPDADPGNPYSYYGSFVSILYQGTTLPDDATVTFTVRPLTPLVDGSQGKTLSFKVSAAALKKGANLIDLPLARYEISGEVTLANGTQRRALLSGATGPATPTQTFTFRPNSMGEGMEGASLWMMGES